MWLHAAVSHWTAAARTKRISFMNISTRIRCTLIWSFLRGWFITWDKCDHLLLVTLRECKFILIPDQVTITRSDYNIFCGNFWQRSAEATESNFKSSVANPDLGGSSLNWATRSSSSLSEANVCLHVSVVLLLPNIHDLLLMYVD